MPKRRRNRPDALANSAKTWRKLGIDSMVYGIADDAATVRTSSSEQKST